MVLYLEYGTLVLNVFLLSPRGLREFITKPAQPKTAMIGSTRSRAARGPVQGTNEFDIDSHREELEAIAESDLPANWIAQTILEVENE